MPRLTKPKGLRKKQLIKRTESKRFLYLPRMKTMRPQLIEEVKRKAETIKSQRMAKEASHPGHVLCRNLICNNCTCCMSLLYCYSCLLCSGCGNICRTHNACFLCSKFEDLEEKCKPFRCRSCDGCTDYNCDECGLCEPCCNCPKKAKIEE